MLTLHFQHTVFLRVLFGLILFMVCGMTATSAQAQQQLERIWDHELNRWLNANGGE